MQTRRSRISAPAVVTVALLALAATSSVTSGAKCFYPKSKSTSSPVTTAPDVTDAPVLEDPSPTQSFGASQATEGSWSTTQSSTASSDVTDAPVLEDPSPTQSFGASQATEGSWSTTQSSTASSEAQPGSYEAPPSSEDSSNAAQLSAQGSADSSNTAQTPTQGSEGSSTPIQGSSEGAVPSTTTVGEHATFGDITSASGECVIGNPSTYVTREDVDWVWKNTMEEYIPQFKNLIFDQLVTNNGSLSYCVRWDNDQKLEKAVASKFQAMIEKQINLWNRWLVGYSCWPIEKIDITVVGFAVRDKSIMDWSDDSLGTIYEGILDTEGSPQCPDDCYKHLGQADSADTSACKGKPFDMSLWPSTKPGEGAIGTGGDWGQRVEINDMLRSMDQEEMVVLLHEIGHGFGLPEMYVDENKPAGYPACVMDASETLTDGDGWLVRSILENIKSRFDF